MVTPFGVDGSVNYSVVESLAAHLVDHGSDGIVVCGTTGESPALTWDEEFQLYKCVQSAVSGKAKIVAGTGSNATQEAIEATRKAAALGVDGSLQVVPYYNKPPQAGLYAHFAAIAKASPDVPLMLYNVPGRTACNLSVPTIAQLAEIENIVAIKEASGNLDQVSQVRSATSSTFSIYSGDDSLTLPMLSVGGCGVVSVASHLVGDRIQAMIHAYEAGQPQKATAEHLSLFPLFKALFLEPNPIPIKAALAMKGWDVGHVRAPLVPASAHVKDELQGLLA